MRYRVFSMLIDLDELDELDARLAPFSHNRFNLYSVHDRDFGVRAGESLAAKVLRELGAAGIGQRPARILLSCYPRLLGYAFNPIALFYCLDERERVFAVVHEVRNTYGERHAYALAALADGADGSAAEDHLRQAADKRLFVSPFNGMDMRYEFRLNRPAERQTITVRAYDADGLVLGARQRGVRRALDTPNLLALLATVPLMTLKVTAAIRLEALRLLLKGVPRHPHHLVHAPARPTPTLPTEGP